MYYVKGKIRSPSINPSLYKQHKATLQIWVLKIKWTKTPKIHRKFLVMKKENGRKVHDFSKKIMKKKKMDK